MISLCEKHGAFSGSRCPACVDEHDRKTYDQKNREAAKGA